MKLNSMQRKSSWGALLVGTSLLIGCGHSGAKTSYKVTTFIGGEKFEYDVVDATYGSTIYSVRTRDGRKLALPVSSTIVEELRSK